MGSEEGKTERKWVVLSIQQRKEAENLLHLGSVLMFTF
jgi:hypothetical protein